MLGRLISVLICLHYGYFVQLTEGLMDSLDDSGSHFSPFHPELFYDTNVLPQNVEMTVFVFKDEVKRLYILIDRDFSPLHLSISPCSAAITWNLYLRQPFIPIRTGKNEHKNNRHNERIENSFVYQFPKISGGGQKSDTVKFLTRYAGVYVLTLKSHVRDTSVRVYVSSSQKYFSVRLPKRPSVTVTHVSTNSVTLHWTHSTYESTKHGKIEYCIAVNPRQNYKTLCSVQAAMHGDIPPRPPRWTGFGFRWERNARKSLWRRIKEIRERMDIKSDIQYTCVGSKTSHIVQGLKEGKIYFFDVFAVDQQSNASAAYQGTNATTRGSSSNANQIVENTLVSIKMSPITGYTAVVVYTMKNHSSALYYFLRSCSGPGPVVVNVTSTRGLDILSTSLMGTKTFFIPKVQAGIYVFKLTPVFLGSRQAEIYLANNYSMFPYPLLPNDTAVENLRTLTTSTSVTLKWSKVFLQPFISEEKFQIEYYIYQTTITKDNKENINIVPNYCVEDTWGSKRWRRRVLILQHRNNESNFFIQKIGGLQPDSEYLFQIEVKKTPGRSLSYEPVFVETNPEKMRT
ncbi:protein NDNF-like [Limulus polyphemus]|uniref:Protein NDNF n=1 Tax=Limulus polyphemus TaxID=6850 RepID=A0ABM1BD07_LIMPO|nr:protein NDNF-like [Limulus polyphemus]